MGYHLVLIDSTLWSPKNPPFMAIYQCGASMRTKL